MSLRLRFEYWQDGAFYVGRLPQIPGVFSQGESIEELESNLREAYRAMLDECDPPHVRAVQYREIEVAA